MSAVGSIMTNTGALQALNAIAQTSNITSSLQNQLASGLSINSPADNPAGYITAQGFTSQLNGLSQATSNANQAVSLLQTAQGAIGQQIGIAQQLNSIAVQAANGTQTPAEAQSLQTLAGQLTSQISTISKQTQFNNINLLDGTFNGVQFQVGANEGQTTTLTIGSTDASKIGMWHSSALATTYKGTNGSAKDGAFGSGAVTVATTGAAFAAGSATITGANGGTQKVASTAGESAASLASAINTLSNQGGVQAQAYTKATFKLTAGSSNQQYSFSIQAAKGSAAGSAIGTKQTIVASSAAGVVSEINSQTSTSGITAALDKNGNLVLTQAAGQNINITGVSSGSLTQVKADGTAVAGVTLSSTNAAGVIQGQVQLQSSGAFSVSNGSAIGVKGNSGLADLADINVSNTDGANAAINVVKYALAALNNAGGNLGAVQQGLTANINNMNTSSQNITTALGVVQDANIPQVSTQLTQQEIKAQSGVAALKSSTQLQQAYLSLLP
ncbi:flagellin [Acidocella sp.]|uniref:flagellin N-terminal helical domain-containing protein n=1 Tax=Acidocella sp. TaxID=50710 RepID=UPI002624AEA8|nr:flagellin [Acidocella sp.]